MLGKYERHEQIGSGTFGNVYLIRLKESNQIYVLKEIKVNSLTKEEEQQAINEIEILSRCRHKNIIRYKDTIRDSLTGTIGIVMEYAEYGDMFTAIKKRNGVFFPEIDVLSWFVQITLALQYIHNHNILHRDLKTQNIFLTGNKMIKIGDFGIAKILKDHELATTSIGTPFYISPEICLKKPYNYKSDIWALGCVLFEMAALIHPFHGHNFHQLFNSILNGRIRSLPSHSCILIQDLVNVLLKLDPEGRPSANQILAIPQLQQHIYRYLDMFSTADSLGVIDVINVASLKKNKNNRRRFSSDDVLTAAKNASALKRTATTAGDVKSLKRKMTPVKETVVPIPAVPNALSKKKLPVQEAYAYKNVKWKEDEIRKSSQGNEFLRSQFAMRQTYSLWRKVVDSGRLNKVGSKLLKDADESNRRCMSAVESDVGYQSGSTSSRMVISEPVGNVSKKSSLADFYEEPLPISYVSERSALSNSSSAASDDEDDVFVNEHAQKPHPDLRIPCQHITQCQNCILDTLWRNRIKSTGGINDTEKLRLKRVLQSVLGEKKFEEVYRVLSEEWNDLKHDQDYSLQSILCHLNYEQRQYVPLLFQLLQMDLITTNVPL